MEVPGSAPGSETPISYTIYRYSYVAITLLMYHFFPVNARGMFREMFREMFKHPLGLLPIVFFDP